MKFLDEFRDPRLATRLVDQIRDLATQRWVLMDVCGGQTHSLVRYGIELELADVVELIHGPGCPICVTSTEVIDFAVALATQPNTVVTSFGDMIRVPGSKTSLMEARSRGGQIKMVYSPMDAVTYAEDHPDLQVVFLAVGFETTAPATALAILQASELDLKNFSIVPAHVRVQPAMEVIMEMPENRVQGFLAAGHVCSITGFECYQSFVLKYETPIVVTGFEPVDLLKGILECVTLLESEAPRVINRYGRSVQRDGNASAQGLVDRVYAVDDRDWRGFGEIPSGGYSLQHEFAAFDATTRFASAIPPSTCESTECRGSEVMSGKIKPKQCAAFGNRCTPEAPLGAPMVSSEGACAAYYRFQPMQIIPLSDTQSTDARS